MPPTTQLQGTPWVDLGIEAERDRPGGRRTKVIVTVDSARHASALISTAAAFARASNSEILAVHVTWIPPQLPLSAAEQFQSEADRTVQAMQRMREHVLDVPIRIALTAGRRVDDVVAAASRRDDVPIAVVPWQPHNRSQSARGWVDVPRVMRRAHCQIVALRQPQPADGPRQIVVAVRPNNPSVHTATAAAALARQHGTPVRLMSLIPHDVDRRAEIDTRMWLARLEGEIAAAGIPYHHLQRQVVTGRGLNQVLHDHTHPDDLILLGVPAGAGPLSQARRRRRIRSFAELDRTTALYRPQPPQDLVQRLKRVLDPRRRT